VSRRARSLRLSPCPGLSRFETAPRLAAWAGVAPGHDASAGKQRSGKTRKGNRPLRAILTQLARAAVRTKDTYLSACYQRLAVRRGKKRAIIAVAHSMMGRVFHMRSRHAGYRDLGPIILTNGRSSRSIGSPGGLNARA
jgi:transposase